MNSTTKIALANAASEWIGRDLNAAELAAQIGRMNVLAISGGVTMVVGSTMFLPVSNGYTVAVTLDASDTYTVRRLFVRSGKVSVKTEVSDVYADEVGEVAYQASCFRG